MKRRFIAAALALILSCSLFAGANETGYAAENEKEVVSAYVEAEELRGLQAVDLNLNEQEFGVLYYTNSIRMGNGLQPLSTFNALQAACDVRAQELVALFSHTRPNGTDCLTALQEQGISYLTAGENIAAGQRDAGEVINAWWNSPGHQANMLSDYNHMGVGYYYGPGTSYTHHWVQLFAGGCTTQSIRLPGLEGRILLMPAGSSFDTLGLAVEVQCDHGTSYLPLIDAMCSGYDKDAVNAIQDITISYNGCTTTLQIFSYPPMQFSDVTTSSWYYGYVEYVYALELMTGLNDTYFGAADPLARAQFAVILHRMNGEPKVAYSPQFPDVANGQWYTDAILWAADTGVVTGYSDTGNFGPGDEINREQMAVMMYRYAQAKGYDTSTKADFSRYQDASQVDGFAVEAMRWAVGTGIITGKDNGTRLDPKGNANRAECATIINRFVTTCGV